MTRADKLYEKLKPEISMVAEKLFDISEALIRKNGNFFAHAAVLTESGTIELVAAAPPDSDDDETIATEVLSLLHDGLRHQAKVDPIKAIGVAESVIVTQEGQRPTNAIKVLFEHKRGLTVALYLPFEEKFLRGFVFGSSFCVHAAPEVKAWSTNDANVLH